MQTYRTQGTCSNTIFFEVSEDGILTGVTFIGGCGGNTKGVAKLAEGRHIDEVISLLKGIKCKGNTSCPDQLATALLQYKQSKSKK